MIVKSSYNHICVNSGERFLGRKNDGQPGIESIWKGWKKLCERVEFMRILTYG
jgi:hypothetical protein